MVPDIIPELANLTTRFDNIATDYGMKICAEINSSVTDISPMQDFNKRREFCIYAEFQISRNHQYELCSIHVGVQNKNLNGNGSTPKTNSNMTQ